MSLTRWLIVLVFFLPVFVSCAGLQRAEPKKPKAALSPPKGEKTLKALKALPKNSSATLKKLQLFIEENKGNQLALKASLYLGDILNRQKKHRKSCEVYKKNIAGPVAYAGDREMFVRYSDCLFKDKQFKEALQILEKLFQKSLDQAERKNIVQKQWDLLQKIPAKESSPYWRLLVFSRLAQYDPSDTKWMIKGEALIVSLTGDEISQLEPHFSSLGLFEGELLFQAGKREWRSRNFKKSKGYFLKALKKLPAENKKSKRAKNYLKALKARLLVNPYLIGAILPLSGHRRLLGEKVLKGLHLGLGLRDSSPWQIVVLDSGSHPDIAQQALESLLYDYHVIGVVGGLSGDTAQAIAEAAEAFGIPALLLSQKQALAKDRLFIFQSALSGQTLMEHLTENLIQNLKITKAALLVPEDNYGNTYAKAFKEAFQSKGGLIVKESSYRSGEVDFKTPIKKLVNLFDLKYRKAEYEKIKQEFLKNHPDLTPRDKKLTPERLLKPEVDFEVLFMPDSLKVLKRIASYLKYFDIKDIHLAGTNLWKEESSNQWKEDFSLLFSATEDVSREVFLKSPFYLKYRKAFQSEPGFFERQAYNLSLALRAALEKRPKDRFQLQKALESVKTFQGAFFTLGIGPDHTFSYPLKLYKIEGGKKSSEQKP